MPDFVSGYVLQMLCCYIIP